MKRGCLISLIALILVLGLGAAVAAFLLLQTPAGPPLVSINSPRNGERVEMGEAIQIHSVARDSRKLSRIELWVDGVLQTAEQASLPGGVSPLPLTTRWVPQTAGAHTLTVRAFNTQGGRGSASVNIDVIQSPDRDNDGVPDDADACADQPGSGATEGCPDRDNDQIRDADDACPDQPGARDGHGCPTPSAGDRDGDGVADGVDACPEQPGTEATAGCPDRDGDSVSDANDACPDQPGSLEARGCPGPEDRDGDGVADDADTCPDERGPAASGGCPDRDADQVRDGFDRCPDTPGPRENSGCPATASGDSDGDGVQNDTDLAPEEAGSAEGGGAPPPGGGADTDGDTIPEEEEATDSGFLDIESIYPLSNLEWIEFDALQFELSNEYPAGTAIYCYAGLGSGPVEQIGPFDSLGLLHWDIAEWAGGANSRRFLFPKDHPLSVRADCYVRIRDLMGVEHLRSLGGIRRQHPPLETNEHEYGGGIQSITSEGGEGGQTFQLVYRLCSPSCADADSMFSVAEPPPQAPILELDRLISQRIARWSWEGDRARLASFRIYLGDQHITALPNRSSALVTRYAPACGTTLSIYMTAVVRNFDGSVVESPHSNTVTWEGRECRQRVSVTFEQIRLGEIGTDEDGRRWGGPIYISLSLSDSLPEDSDHVDSLWIRGGHCGLWRTSSCWGVWLDANSTYSLQRIIDAVAQRRSECITQWCMMYYEVPWSRELIAHMDPEDNLVIRARIGEYDSPSGRDHGEIFFDGALTLRPEEITNGIKIIRSGNSEFTVRLELLEPED